MVPIGSSREATTASPTAPGNSIGGGGRRGDSGQGTWRNAAFHVATTIATPAAYAPLPFALASLGWPLGNFNFLIFNFVGFYFSVSVWFPRKLEGENCA